MSATDAAVFAAIEAITEGQWDRYLHRLRGAIALRCETDEYRATLVATRPATTDPLISTERSGCSCMGHAFPGVSHIVACCDQPHIDQRFPSATTDGGAG